MKTLKTGVCYDEILPCATWSWSWVTAASVPPRPAPAPGSVAAVARTALVARPRHLPAPDAPSPCFERRQLNLVLTKRLISISIYLSNIFQWVQIFFSWVRSLPTPLSRYGEGSGVSSPSPMLVMMLEDSEKVGSKSCRVLTTEPSTRVGERGWVLT